MILCLGIDPEKCTDELWYCLCCEMIELMCIKLPRPDVNIIRGRDSEASCFRSDYSSLIDKIKNFCIPRHSLLLFACQIPFYNIVREKVKFSKIWPEGRIRADSSRTLKFQCCSLLRKSRCSTRTGRSGNLKIRTTSFYQITQTWIPFKSIS